MNSEEARHEAGERRFEKTGEQATRDDDRCNSFQTNEPKERDL